MTEWFVKKTYASAVDEAADRFSHRTALSFDGLHWSFAELREEVNTAASRLARLGVAAGDVVGLWLDNRPEWVFTFFAAAKLGAVVLPMNTGLRSDDCRYVLQHSRCSTLVFAPRSGPVSYLEVLESIIPSLGEQDPAHLSLTDFPQLRRIVGLNEDGRHAGIISWNESPTANGNEGTWPVVNPDGVATIMYTSGTTGAPKGVMHSHHALRNVVDQANRLNVREADVILMFLPLFHAYGLYEGPLMSLLTGARMCLLDRFDAGLALATLAAERATLCFGFSTHFQDMLAHSDFAQTDRTSLRAGILAVGPRSLEPLAFRVQREFGGKMVSGFGMTEIGVGATLGFIDEDEGAFRDHVRISASGVRVPDRRSRIPRPSSDGEPGEVLVRGYQVMLGYLDDPDQTARAVDVDGWLHTGDIGVRLPDGYIKILGRYKDMLRVAGENVDPSEVEALYIDHPALATAVVVGVPDDRLEEVPCLCIQLRDGCPFDEELRQELLGFADGRLAAFKRPRHIVSFDRLPMTASGKTARAEIQAIAHERVTTAVET